MHLSTKIFILILLVFFISGCSSNNNVPPLPSDKESVLTGKSPTGKSLKQACVEASICAIELEIKRHQNWIDQREKEAIDDGEIDLINGRLDSLNIDLEKLKNTRLDDYEVPAKLQLKAWVREPVYQNSILYIEDMTRSGPWYHIVGIKGDEYSVIKPKNKYLMTIYLVCPRYYWGMPSYYVYIDDYEYQE